MISISISEARKNLAELVNQVTYNKQTVVIKKMGKPVAMLINPKVIPNKKMAPKPRNLPSATAGTIKAPKNFDITKVFEAMKEPYDVKSLLGR